MNTATAGQTFTTTIRKSFGIGPRTRNHRNHGDLRADMLEAIQLAVTLPGYYSEERTAIMAPAWGAKMAYDKHVDGYRIPGELRFYITSLSPWNFAALIGDMIDAGVTNCGEGEQYFASMGREVRQAA